MKSIFLNENPSRIALVYPPEIMERLSASADLDTEVISKAKLIKNKNRFKDTRFIFTTWNMPSLTEDEIKEYLPSLEAVFYAAGSVQYFARPFLNCGVKVFSAWAANAVPVAEYALAQIILANKGFFASSKLANNDDYSAAMETQKRFDGNYGGYVGIIGAGMIGKLLIKMLKAYHLNILVYDPFLPDAKAEEFGVCKVELPTLFEKCRVVSNHLANNEQTKGMLNYDLFKLMPADSVFINTGRGAQVAEADLARILSERKDFYAILDVTYPEPPKDDNPFYSLGNCILTPHIAGSIGNEVHRMSEYMSDEFDRCKNGEDCLYEVTLKMLDTMA